MDDDDDDILCQSQKHAFLLGTALPSMRYLMNVTAQCTLCLFARREKMHFDLCGTVGKSSY